MKANALEGESCILKRAKKEFQSFQHLGVIFNNKN
jgi:hypothetical protein